MITIAIPSSRCRRSIRSRIWAWTVTSRAVVGSSAISSLGSLASAIAIITRWRMPPENSWGYWSHAVGGVGDSYQPEQLDRARPRLALGHVAVGEDRVGELPADLVEGVQGGQRVLEDHRDFVAADRPQLVVVHRHEVAAFEQDPAADLGALMTGQAEHRQRRDGLAGTRLAHDPECLARHHLVGDPVDRLHHPVFGVELDPQVLHPQQRLGGAHAYLTLGSMKA